MATVRESAAGFTAFYRQYTKTWLHALATAALTAFGTLTVVHRGFAALAVGAYVLPPIVLYMRTHDTQTDEDTEPDEVARSAAESTTETGTGTIDTETTKDAHTRAAATSTDAHWTAVDTPTEATLRDVTVTDENAYAVGATGIVLTDGGEDADWVPVLTDGPNAAATTLRGVDTTADGEAVWIAGDSGTVARLETATDRHVDYSSPRGRTDTWTAIAVGGSSSDERLLLANGSGEVFRGRYRDGTLVWDEPVKPGSGSSLCGAVLVDDRPGYVCDTNDGVFETTDGGDTFQRVGIDGANGTLTDVATSVRDTCLVTADDGVCHRYDGGTWTPVRLGDDALEAITMWDGYALACGGRAVYERETATADWDRSLTAADSLRGVSATDTRAVAVGADGAIVERALSVSP